MTQNHLSHNSNTDPNQRWLIVGAGAIGLLWYSKLYHAQCRPTLLHRNPTLIRSLTVINNKHHESIPVQEINLLKPTIKERHFFTHVLFCTKSFDLEKAYTETKPFLHHSAHILCLCNGMGPQQRLMAQLENDHFLSVGITSEGVTKKNSNTIERRGEGATYFGQFLEKQKKPIQFLKPLYINHIEDKLWEKLAINAAINPLTALFNIQNGVLLKPPYNQLFEACCDEISHFLKSTQIKQKNYKELTIAVATATGNNKSSMLQDTLLGKKTEIENICGYLLAQANKLNMELPIQSILLQALTEQIDKSDAKRSLWKRVNNTSSI